MSHDGRQASSNYGTSLLIDGLPVWKRLRLTEDSILLTRLTRGLLRYIYKIRVDSWATDSAAELIDEYVTLLKRARTINTDGDNANYDSKFGVMSSIEDIILPVWGEQGDVSVEKIGGDPDIRWIVDVDKLENQLAMALRVPMSLLGGSADDATGSLGSEAISKLDIQFAKTAKRLQRAIKEGITRICQIHLAYMNMDPDPSLFEVNMTQTSSAEEEQLKDTLDTGVDIIDKYMEMFERMSENHPEMEFDHVEFFNYMNQKILKLNDLDINDYIKIVKVPAAVPETEEDFSEPIGGAPTGMGTGGAAGEDFSELDDTENLENAEALPDNMAPPKELPVERRTGLVSKKHIIQEYLKKQTEQKEKPVRHPVMNLDLTAALPIRAKSYIGNILTESKWKELYKDVVISLTENTDTKIKKNNTKTKKSN